MKRAFQTITMAALSLALAMPTLVQAQKVKEEKGEKEKKEQKREKEEKEMEVITITRKGDADKKVIIEINGDKVLVNGKPVDEGKDGEVTVNRHKIRDVYGLRSFDGPMAGRNFNFNDNFAFWNGDEDRAMLGVVTEKSDKGVKVTELTKDGGAEMAGLKKDDIIVKVDETKVEDPDDLTKVIRDHKPGDKVGVTYLRDGKEQKAIAELTKWKGMNFAITAPRMPDMRVLEDLGPRLRGQLGDAMVFYGDRPRLGISVQDTEDGNGVKIIDVEDDGNGAKAGLKEDDIITHINDKAVNSADEVARLVRESREKPSITFKIKRNGKPQSVDVKMPRKLKTADL